jgi:hypothetical protein
LADANENRDWRIYSDFAQILLGQVRNLYVDEDLGLELDETVYALEYRPSICALGRASGPPKVV